MNIPAFVADFAYQIVTWVCIGTCVAGIFYCLGKRNRKGCLLWGIGLLLSILAMLALLAYQHAHKLQPTIIVRPEEKSYVTIRGGEIEPLRVGKSPVVLLLVENGAGSTTTYFRNVTVKFTRFVPEKYLKLEGTWTDTVHLTAHQAKTLRWSFDSLILTQDQINDLNAANPMAELYFFARSEYFDDTGSHPLQSCWRYDKFVNHLAICSDDIKIE